MHTGVQMKYVSKLTDARRTSREDGFSLLDCVASCRGSMPLRRRMVEGHSPAGSMSAGYVTWRINI